MFSQLRKRLEDGLDAVEHMATTGATTVANGVASAAGTAAPDASDASNTAPARPSTPGHTPSTSVDSLRPTSHSSLAESALTNLRRSLALQRAASPSTADASSVARPTSRNSASRTMERELAPVPVKRGSSSLEDRLRASFTIGDTSASNTPEPVTILPPTPTEVSATASSFEPYNIPLPLSPPPVRGISTPQPFSPSPIPVFDDPLSPNLNAILPSERQAQPPKSPSPLPPSPKIFPELHAPQPKVLRSPIPLHSTGHSPFVSFESAEHMDDLSLPPPEAPADTKPVDHEDLTHEPASLDSVLTTSTPTPEAIVPLEPPSASPPVPLPSVPLPSEIPDESSTTTPPSDGNSLAERLKLVEQRFSDVSASFKRLQAERTAADKALRAWTPLQTVSNAEALREHLKGLVESANTSNRELETLRAQIKQQEERMDELRDTHRLEGASRSDQIEHLKRERIEAETLLAAARSKSASDATELATSKSEVTSLRVELEQARKSAKEEEEKRVKAIQLLKTVRLKSVKTEKELEEVMQERGLFRAEVAKEREAWAVERAKLAGEVEKAKVEGQKEAERVRVRLEGDMNALRERLTKEAAAQRSQFELEAINAKATYNQELTSRTSRITQLESSLHSMTAERDSLFDQLQLRQAEVESSQSRLETLENQTNELHHLLREANERNSSLSDELFEVRSELEHLKASSTASSSSATGSMVDPSSLIADVERRYEAKLYDLRTRMSTIEKERSESEEEWSRTLAQRSKEIERLRTEVESAKESARSEEKMAKMEEAEEAIRTLEREVKALKGQAVEAASEVEILKATLDQTKDSENLARLDQSQSSQKVSALMTQLEELQNKEALLRASNKTLRDELRKVQNSAALLERQRNPGVGYWSQSGNQSRTNVHQTSTSQDSRNGSRPASPAQSVFSDVDTNGSTGANVARKSAEEEVNLEYLRNIIIQFLEHKEMRPNLVRVMSVILRFTPAETRRLAAKV